MMPARALRLCTLAKDVGRGIQKHSHANMLQARERTSFADALRTYVRASSSTFQSAVWVLACALTCVLDAVNARRLSRAKGKCLGADTLACVVFTFMTPGRGLLSTRAGLLGQSNRRSADAETSTRYWTL